MTFKHKIAKAASKVMSFAIRRFSSKDATNFPGRVALKIDKDALANEILTKVLGKKIIVVGTNGKTSVTNLIAHILKNSKKRVLCNYSGANLKSGITSAVLSSKKCDVGVFESDELWLKESLPDVSADFVLLLNLFRDQLDRCGEIERIQSSIVEALKNSPKTTLIFNADDPFCAQVALVSDKLPERKNSPKSLSFGIDEPLNLKSNSVIDTTMCQICGSMLTYKYKQYDKIGKYECKNCCFERPKLNFRARNVHFSSHGISLEVVSDGEKMNLVSTLVGSYNVYNVLAASIGSRLMGAKMSDIQKGLNSFNPKNGRLQRYSIKIDGQSKEVLLNLAKNPTGFNQNLRIIADLIDDTKLNTVTFFINDKTADGHDISWLWDVDFEELANLKNARFYCGGTRALDMALRLKHANISSYICKDVNECLACEANEIFIIANYTALPPLKVKLDKIEKTGESLKNKICSNVYLNHQLLKPIKGDLTPIRIAHVMPELLNLYGDSGNVRILENRLKWRGIDCEIVAVHAGDDVEFSKFDLVVVGGSPDREQKQATCQFRHWKQQIYDYIESGAPMLAICGSYQMLGKTWLLDGFEVEGLGILNMKTTRPGTSTDRLVSNIVLRSKISKSPVVGFENHAGRTHLGEGLDPFGEVISKVGCGNSEESRCDGVLYKGLIGTYLHGPLLSKNPEVADWLLARAIAHANGKNLEDVTMITLDDLLEIDANEFMQKQLL